MQKIYKLKAFTLAIFLIFTGEVACKSLTVGDCEGFSWSSDSKQIVLKTEKAIYILNTESFQRYQIDVSGNNKGYTNDFPTWSPDGQQVLFSAALKNIDNRGISQIYIASKKGHGNSHMLTSNGSSPQWSPDSKRIAFQSYKEGRWEICMMNADGSKLVRLASDSAPYERPLWSPDSKNILFSTSPTVNEREIYIVATNGLEKPKKLKDGSAPAWSHDGQKIAYINSALEVHTLNQKNSKDSCIYRLPISRAYKYGLEWESNDSQLFTWFIHCKEDRIFSYNNCELKVYNVDLNHLKSIREISFKSVGTSPIWSPDRKKIGFISQGFLYIANADGSQLIRLN